MKENIKIGIDLGGTKIALIALKNNKDVLFNERVSTPKGDYQGVLTAISGLVARAKNKCATNQTTIGIGIPGSVSPQTGLVQNANSTWMNDKPFKADIETALGQAVKLANDANCLALSEAFDGAAKGAKTVFGVILGTGCGGGLIIDGKLIEGRHAIGGEWGHTPLPWMQADEFPGDKCWCGRLGCLETLISGSGLEKDHLKMTGNVLNGKQIFAAANGNNQGAKQTLKRHVGRLARGLAVVTNLYDPDVIVLGGGLSDMDHLYEQLPALMKPFVFCDHLEANIQKPLHGDASGARGAARLWD